MIQIIRIFNYLEIRGGKEMEAIESNVLNSDKYSELTKVISGGIRLFHASCLEA